MDKTIKKNCGFIDGIFSAKMLLCTAKQLSRYLVRFVPAIIIGCPAAYF
jgi:hypothetical protein